MFLRTLFGLSLTDDERQLFTQCTQRPLPRPDGYAEAWLCVGRRGGKSFVLALVAVFLACLRDWMPFLGPGEIATVMIIAADRRQARTILRYIGGLITSTPMLASMVTGETASSISLRNRVVIEVHTASFRTTRGYTIVAALLDELAFWPTDENSADPDIEVINAIKPGMVTIPGAMLLCASSPYARRGALWTSYKNHFGKDDPVLVWQAPTRVMNPSVPQSTIDASIESDPAKFTAEYYAEFRSDIEGVFDRVAVERCISDGVYERPFEQKLGYVGFADPSGGSSDSFALCIAHRSTDQFIIDCLREIRAPFDPSVAVGELAGVLKSYKISKIVGDKYAGLWPTEQFQKYGIRYEQSAKSKSDLYRELLPVVNSRMIELLDYPRAINQLCALERRVSRSGKDTIDHPQGPAQHDDLSNVIAGAVAIAQRKRRDLRLFGGPATYGNAEVIELDPRTGRRLPQRRMQLVRTPDGTLQLIGGDNSCIPGPGVQ